MYSRYRHPKKQYGKIKTCYIFRKRVCMSPLSKDKFDPDIPLSERLVTKCLHSKNHWPFLYGVYGPVRVCTWDAVKTYDVLMIPLLIKYWIPLMNSSSDIYPWAHQQASFLTHVGICCDVPAGEVCWTFGITNILLVISHWIPWTKFESSIWSLHHKLPKFLIQLGITIDAELTITVKDFWAEFPTASVAEHVTVVIPIGNWESDGGLQDS